MKILHGDRAASSGSLILIGAVLASLLSSAPAPASAVGPTAPTAAVVGGSPAPTSLMLPPAIVGGEPTSITSAPWQVAVLNSSETSSNYLAQFCAGSIVAPTWILTAAHCVEDKTAADVDVLAGTAYLADDAAGRLDVTDVIVHPGWDPNTYENDIALLRLSAPLVYSASVQPIALPAGDFPNGAPAMVTGWGSTFYSDGNDVYNWNDEPFMYPRQLHAASLFVASDDVCSSYRDDTPGFGFDPVTMVCAGNDLFSVDTCQGDSGGPLVAWLNAQPQLVGVTSWGIGCAWLSPGVYADVAYFEDWIASYTLLGSPRFTDVPVASQFAVQIDWLASTGITTGYPDSTFRPLASVNRDAMAAFLYRFAGEPAFTAPAVSPFTDITTSTQFYKEITWLASTMITTGYPDGTFRPSAQIGRDAMAAFLYRFAAFRGSDVASFTQPFSSPFVDVAPSTQFYREITWLASEGISTGYPDNTFRPGGSVARDAMAAFLFRFDGARFNSTE